MFDGAISSPGRLILPLVFVAACAACAGPTSSTGTASITSHPNVGGSVPGIADSACAGGTGTVISVPPSWLAGAGPIVTEMLPGGITLVVASAGYPPASYAVAGDACPPGPANPFPLTGRWPPVRRGTASASIGAGLSPRSAAAARCTASTTLT